MEPRDWLLQRDAACAADSGCGVALLVRCDCCAAGFPASAAGRACWCMLRSERARICMRLQWNSRQGAGKLTAKDKCSQP